MRQDLKIKLFFKMCYGFSILINKCAHHIFPLQLTVKVIKLLDI